MQNTTQPIDDGGNAFPIPYVAKPDGTITHCEDGYGQGGMRLRDWFAGQWLAGLGACPTSMPSASEIARGCYEVADAMIAERNNLPK